MKTSSHCRAALLGALIVPLAAPILTAPALAAPAPNYTSKKEGFAIYLPGKPKTASRPMTMPGLGTKNINFVTAGKAPVAYVVIPMLLPGTPKGASINQFLDGVQRGFTMSTAAKLLSSKKISLQGSPGREILVRAGTNLMRGRFFVKGNRSYQVVAVSPQANDAKYRAQVTQVLDSFRLLK